MSYDHIPNLYQDQTILMFRRVYALEKIHGTSAKISWRDGHLHLHGGGAPGFQDVFDRAALTTAFEALGHPRVSVHGEAYGASVMRMGLVYGPALRFVAFAVKIDELWLNVPNAADVADKLALAFVAFEEVDATVEALDFERDRPSRQAVRNGMGEQKAEGIVIHPLITLRKNNGDRLMAKHKREEFSERASGQDARVVDPAQLVVLAEAEAIALEWVTGRRLEHVLAHLTAALGREPGLRDTAAVLWAMTEDVYREAGGEVVRSRASDRAISTRARELFHARLPPPLMKVADGEGGGVGR